MDGWKDGTPAWGLQNLIKIHGFEMVLIGQTMGKTMGKTMAKPLYLLFVWFFFEPIFLVDGSSPLRTGADIYSIERIRAFLGQRLI